MLLPSLPHWFFVMPPVFMPRQRRDGTNGDVWEQVYLRDPDAREYFRLDEAGFHLAALRRLPLVWVQALSAMGNWRSAIILRS